MNDVSKRKYNIKKKNRKRWSEAAKEAQSKRMKEMWKKRKLKTKKAKPVNPEQGQFMAYVNVVEKVKPKPMWKRIIDAILGR